MPDEVEAVVTTLKSYKGPWLKRGPLLLACGKCQRKLKHETGDDVEALVRNTERQLVESSLPIVRADIVTVGKAASKNASDR